jgi:hypothetical protein
MRPENSLLSGSPGYVFAQEGEAYLVYLPSGRSFRLDLTGTSNRFEAVWFNPGDGSMQSIDLIQGGEEVNFVAPDGNDWVLILRRYLGVHPEITSTPPLQAQVNQVYRYDVEAIGDPSPNFALLSAPAGMTIDPGSGLIQWVPAISGNFAVTVEARNTAGSDTQTFTVQVAAPTTLTPTRTLTSQPTRTPTPMLTHLPTRTATITPKPSATPIGQTSPTPTRRPKPPGQSIFLPLVTH